MYFRKNPAPLFVLFCFLASCGEAKTSSDFLVAATQHYNNGKLNAAIIEAKNAVVKKPDNADARKLLGELHLLKSNAPAAEKELRKHQQLTSNDQATRALLSQALAAQGKAAEVQALSLDGIDNDSKIKILVSKSQVLMGQQDFIGAAEHLSDALAIDPGSSFAMVTRARLNAATGNWDAARADAEAVLATDPENGQAWDVIGDVEYMTQKPEQAHLTYQKAIDAGQGSFQVRYKQISALISTQELDQARASLDDLKEAGFEHPSIPYLDGVLEMFAGNLSAAQNLLEEVAKYENVNPNALYALGLTHLAAGNFESAEQYAKQFANVNNNAPAALNLLARIRLENGSYAQAESTLLPLFSQYRDNTELRELLTVALVKQGKIDQAVDIMGLLPTRLDQLETILFSGNRFDYTSSNKDLQASEYTNLMQVQALLAEQELDRALEATQTFAASHPTLATPHVLAGRIHLAKNQTTESVNAFHAAVRAMPENITANHAIASIALQADNKELASDQLYKLLAIREEHLPTLLTLADIESGNGNAEKAQSHIQIARLAHPDSAEPVIFLANSHLSQLQPKKALAVLDELPAQTRNQAVVRHAEGMARLQLEQPAQAQTIFLQLANAQPDHANWQYLVARTHDMLNEHELMKERLEKAVESDPNHYEARMSLARLALQQQDKTAFDAHLSVLEEIAPDPAVLDELTSGYAGNGTGSAEQPASQNPIFETTESVIAHAQSLWNQDSKPAAKNSLRNWLIHNNNDLQAHKTLATMYIVDGENSKAARQYQHIVALSDDDAEVLNNLAYLLKDSDPQQALEYATRAITIAPDSAEILDTLAALQFENNQIDDAVASITRAAELAPKNKSIQYQYARIMAGTNRHSQAIATLSQLLESPLDFPERAEAAQMLQRLQ